MAEHAGELVNPELLEAELDREMDLSVAAGEESLLWQGAQPEFGDGSASLLSVVDAPVVTNVRGLSPTELLVTFSRPMKPNADLFNTSKYVLTGGLTVTKVTRITGSQVSLKVTPAMETDALYQLTVNP